MNAKKITFTGKVQAVGFRNDTCRIMKNFDLTGYVKNIEPDGPYSGNQVELFIQSENEDELKKAIEIMGLYFGKKHIHKTTIRKVKPDNKIKTFAEQRKDYTDWYKAHPVIHNSGTVHKSGMSQGRFFDDYPDFEPCIACGFRTAYKCECGKVHLCKICSSNAEFNNVAKNRLADLHICTKKTIPERLDPISIHKSSPEIVEIKEDGKQYAKACIENLCSECGKLYTTMRADCCNSPLCRACAEIGLHKCKAKTEKEGVIKKILKTVF